MQIVFHSLDVEAGRRIGAGRCAPVDVRPFDPEVDAAAVFALADACRAGAGQDEAAFAPAGIAAELVSRPGRRVDAWLAWPQEEPSQPLGLVAVVEAGDREPRRFSIAWLFVDPQARRRGIATALVAHALAAAHARGAARLAAETHGAWPAASSFWRSIASRLD
jgi:GNAT superfamily N-acetyltransferase